MTDLPSVNAARLIRALQRAGFSSTTRPAATTF